MESKATRGAGDHLLVKSITPVDGKALDVGTVTAFVGLNNCGKSEALRDMLRLAANLELRGEQPASGEELVTTVVGDLAFVSKLAIDRLTRGLTRLDDGQTLLGIGPDLKTPCQRTPKSDIKNVLYRPVLTARSVRTTSLGELMPLRVTYSTPESRRTLLEPSPACSPTDPPENLLQALHYADQAVHAELEAAFHDAFPDLYVRLDTTERINLRLRVAAKIPDLTGDPIGDVRLFAGLRPADQEGDGMQSYLAMVLSLLVTQGRLALIDQPEAGLHPEQCRRLGRWISSNAARLGNQVFVATHSPELLSGLLEGSTDVTIARLARNGSTTFHPVPGDVCATLAHYPVLRSQKALDCLFARGVVIVPQGDDEVIYQTVAMRLLNVGNIQFLHTHGSRHLGSVAKILRKVNVPICVVADLDALHSEAGFSELVKAVTGDDPPAPWLATRERLARHVEGMMDERELSANAHEVESFLDGLKAGGQASSAPESHHSDHRHKWARLERDQLGSIPQELRVWVEELLEELKQRGVFISPKGGFTGWLPVDPPTNDRDVWFAKVVQTLHRGECPPDLRAFVADFLAHMQALAMPQRAARKRPVS